MKYNFKVLAAALAAITGFTQTAFAQTQFIRINGFTDKNAIGVTVLMVDKGTDINKVKQENILWIDQGKINQNGSFSIKIPFFTEEECDFYSNALTYNDENKTKTLYVSADGSDGNSGEDASAPLKTLAAAYKQIDSAKEIILLDDTEYVNVPKLYDDGITIKGVSSDVKLYLNEDVQLAGDMSFENLTINGSKTVYANGYELVIGKDVQTYQDSSVTTRLTVYGGGNGTDVNGNTNITLLGGRYQTIYGGGNGGNVTGDTSVIVGGTVNIGDGINDDASNISPCYVYGGGNNGAVLGKTNVTLQENAIVKFLVGAGTGTNGIAKDTNIFINGGQVMNAYGGSSTTVLPEGTCTHITMTGGVAEALFGGCEYVAMTGHTFVRVLGGEVTRRVYTGCYNEVDIGLSGLSIEATWKNNNYVSGTTTLAIGPDAKFNTKNGLSDDNSINVGVFAGSRMGSQKDEEINTVIFLDDSYSAQKSVIGEKSSKYFISLSTWLKSFEDYTVQAGINGTVYGTTTGGTVYVEPDKGYYGVIDENKYENENVPITNDTSITFEKYDFAITDVRINKNVLNETETEISADVELIAENKANESKPKMYAAVYDESGTSLLAVDSIETTADMAEHSFEFDYKFEKDKTYIVKIMMWNSMNKPLTSQYSFTVK